MKNFSPAEKFIVQHLEQSLPQGLYYHGLHHTLYVFNAAIKIARTEKIGAEDMKLLRIAALYHDAGFISTYKNHETAGCKMARKILPVYDYTHKEIKIICGIIMATKLPQRPTTKLERIICDADLDYLGRKDFYKISNTLFCEMKTYTNFRDEKKWNGLQKKFLEKHCYFTDYAKEKLDPSKQKHLQRINKIVEANK